MKYLTLFVLIFACFSGALARAETITLVADSWCPYNCEPEEDKRGFMVEIARRAFAKHGIEVAYQTMPWTRAIEDTRVAKYDGLVGASKNDAPDFIFPSIEQGWMKNGFYVLQSSKWKFTGMDSLADISFGAIKDYSYGDKIDAYIVENRRKFRGVQLVYGSNPLELNIKKLFAGRIDAVLEDEHVMNAYLTNRKLHDKIIQAGSLPDSRQSAVYIAFSPLNPNSKRYAELLSAETSVMRRNGELKAILDRYEVKDWKR